MRARHATVAWFLLSVGFVLACGDLPIELDQPVEDAQAVDPWPVFQDDGSDFIKAGTQDGLVADAPLTLLGPAIGDTNHREIVGSAKVVKVWDDLAKLERERFVPDVQGGVVARPRTPEDAADLEAIPEVVQDEPVTQKTTASSTKTAAKTVELPADLRDPIPDNRIDALIRYEPLPDATEYIVYVMKKDSNADVRKKAWRVVKARWKRGTGSRSEHERAAVWLGSYGSLDLRLEAIGTLGNRSGNLSSVSRHLDDSVDRVRKKAAHAVANLGARTGQQSKARTLLNDRLDKEGDSKVRKEVLDALADV